MNLPKFMAEEICSVQPMMSETSKFSFKIVKTRLVERKSKLKGTWKCSWENGFYYAPYIPLQVHEYPKEKEKWLDDEDFLV